VSTDAGRHAANYVGRFAPSPTGPLHFGSIVAAVGSWLDARRAGGRWLLRLDDLDAPRNVPGAADAILRELERLGLHWDGVVERQSARAARYQGALASLRREGLAFACGCSRRALVDGVYPGTCRAGLAPGVVERALRLRVDDRPVTVHDAIQGAFTQHLRSAVGDFVVLRADGIVAYHLATVMDDAASGVTDVVRGADLLDSTPRQLALYTVLGHAPPRYAHLPVAVNAAGQKLSKQTHAADSARSPADALWRDALTFLGHPPPAELAGAGADQLAAWARSAWSLDRVPPIRPCATP
jgi:glutamyl-Q tRNA(Asp) synthetase